MIDPDIIRFKEEDTPDLSELRKPKTNKKKRKKKWPFDWLPFGCEW
jgi:hypothetical protein